MGKRGRMRSSSWQERTSRWRAAGVWVPDPNPMPRVRLLSRPRRGRLQFWGRYTEA